MHEPVVELLPSLLAVGTAAGAHIWARVRAGAPARRAAEPSGDMKASKVSPPPTKPPSEGGVKKVSRGAYHRRTTNVASVSATPNSVKPMTAGIGKGTKPPRSSASSTLRCRTRP